jgi:diguanylate cyclase (GGDEF)-like protein
VQIIKTILSDTSTTSTQSSHGRHKRQLIILGVFAIATSCLLGFFVLQFGSVSKPKRNYIQDLQTTPVGGIRLEGVVTYVDQEHQRFWLQDETGALAITSYPNVAGLTAGKVIRVEATKTHQYNPLIGLSSVELKDVIVVPAKYHEDLPEAVKTTLTTLPEKEKNGIRVQVEGVVHYVGSGLPGYSEIAIGESSKELAVTVHSEGDLSRFINARVHIVGVSEAIHDDAGTLVDRHLWVNSSRDIQLVERAPESEPLYTVKSLYTNLDSRNGHIVRVRGRVTAQLTGDRWLIEDQWGTVACQFDKDLKAPLGKVVEIHGFPNEDLRIDLLHATATSISANEISELDSQNSSEPVLTSVASIHTLSHEEAKRAIRVRVTGVLTFVDSDWGQLFIQDSTGGIYIKYAGARFLLLQGERVTVEGLTNPGEYAPIIVAAKFTYRGQGTLPIPVRLTPYDALSGGLDSKFVEVEGVVHSIYGHENPNHLNFDIYSPLGRIHVSTAPNFGSINTIQNLQDTRIRVRGVCSTLFNSRRQLVGFQLTVSSFKDVQVLDRGDPDPFSSNTLPISELLTFSSHARFDHRVKVIGSVTALGPDFFYIQDQTAGLQVQGDTHGLKLEDSVAVVGYAEPGGYSPVLTDATVRTLRHDVAIEAPHITAEALTGGAFDSRLVTIDGRLLSVISSLDSKTLVLESGGRTFNAELQILTPTDPSPVLEEGSVLRLTGICSAQVDPHAKYLLLTHERVGFKILVRSPRDVVILRAASWWTLSHAAIVLLVLLIAVLATFGWVMLLQQRIRKQTVALRQASQKAKAIDELLSTMQDVTLQQDFSRHVTVPESGEIAPLAIEFNKMLSELQMRETAKQKAEDKLQHQALTDELTGLPNRRLLSDRLSQTLAIAKRERNIVGILYLDLDGFKLVNDSLGHMVGDTLLRLVSERLRERIRHSDTLARLGGDEFTVVLTKLASIDDAARVAQSLLDVLAKPFLIETHEITISASIGISLFPEHGVEAADLLQQADSAMYTAKRNGKNQLTYYSVELGSLVRERLSLENQLRGAISRGEISAHYQPEFDIVTGRLIRFEALARWTHPTLGMISPSKFIPIAEETGLIIPLGAYIMESACAEAVKWQTLSSAPIQVAVNVSSLQFMRETFVEEVKAVLGRTGLSPRLLQIELTESVMLSGPERAAEIMKTLRSFGISVAIDDFGTGYSCFSYLPRLPFNALKIDRSFVKELESRAETKAMVQSLVALAKNLSMQVIVEGIETQEQLSLVRKLGGNEVQGYLLGRPTPDPASQLAKRNPALESFEASAGKS